MKLYNTLSRKKEQFEPLQKNKVRMYTCGPTVYDYAHIGNWRSFLFADFLRRTLEYLGYEVKQVMNITDVGHLTDDADQGEDKVEKKARQEKKTAWDIAHFYTEAFLADMKRLNVEKPHKLPKATDHIAEMIALVKKLESKGYTYKISDGIYFDTSKFADYGKLSGQSLKEKMAGARVEPNPEKKNPTDFVLWKLSPKDKKRQMEWDSPWGTGFPGWHIECSVLSTKYLGQPFDIHTGGVDHIGVHHENEIAQSEAAYGKPMARFWVHIEHLQIKGEKMAKSEQNIITVKDLLDKGYNPLAFRLLIFSAHYRRKQNFTFKALDQAEANLEKIYETARRLQRVRAQNKRPVTTEAQKKAEAQKKKSVTPLNEIENNFNAHLKHDLNTAQATSDLFEYVSETNKLIDKRRLNAAQAEQILSTFFDFDQVLGLKIKENSKPSPVPKEIKKLAQRREKLRQEGKFEQADELRKKIEAKGFIIKDTDSGPIIEKYDQRR